MRSRAPIALDRTILDAPGARFGIAATGKGYLDVRQALDELGIDDARARDLGLRLYKVGMTWPLEPAGARAFAEGLEEILVVEEKRAVVEDQLAKLLYAQPQRPRITGKRDEHGARAAAHRRRAVAGGRRRRRSPRGSYACMASCPSCANRSRASRACSASAAAGAAYPLRAPYFCSGCPHNTSTRVPEGSRALAGIGCH